MSPGDRPAGRVRIAVIGVGALGRHHVRLLAAMDGVELVGAVDIRAERAQEAATAWGTGAFTDAREVLDRIDAAIVAVPTEAHLEVARPLLERGLAVLVEKPMARSVAEADELIAAAAAGDALLAVGQTERYNPAVTAVRRLVTNPGFIEGHRLGTFPERSLDIDVVFDLMIHDLDVVSACVGADVVAIEAVGVPVLTDRVDIANARLRFATGCVANLTASRISRDRVRKVRFFQPSTYMSVDYAAQAVEAWRLVRRNGGPPAIEGGPVPVVRDEPLRLELADFVRAVRKGASPEVTAADGRRALDLAERIAAAMAAGSPI